MYCFYKKDLKGIKESRKLLGFISQNVVYSQFEIKIFSKAGKLRG